MGRAQRDLTGSAQDAKSGMPPSRLEELTPRLEALMADFAHLEEVESLELEPLPAFIVPLKDDDGGDRSVSALAD